jgi:branched-chain amino acid transport system substrate-binding protein
MQVVLDAVAAAGARRDGVIAALFSVRDRQSVLGTYSIDAFGDTTLRSFGIYRISRGRLRWSNAVVAPAGYGTAVSERTTPDSSTALPLISSPGSPST